MLIKVDLLDVDVPPFKILKNTLDGRTDPQEFRTWMVSALLRAVVNGMSVGVVGTGCATGPATARTSGTVARSSRCPGLPLEGY